MATSEQVKEDPSQAVGKSERGFAAMDPECQREIARKDGKAVHQVTMLINSLQRKPARLAAKAVKPTAGSVESSPP